MPYVFAMFMVLNFALFGYFLIKPNANDTGTLESVQAQLQKPLTYENSSDDLPPLIGEK